MQSPRAGEIVARLSKQWLSAKLIPKTFRCFSPFISEWAPRLIVVALMAAVLLGFGRPLLADGGPSAKEKSNSSLVAVDPLTERAIAAGLAYLSSRQHPDGGFGSGGQFRQNVGITALAGMAFLAAGHSPGIGPEGERIEAIIDFLLKSQEPSGLLIREDSAGHGPLYGHGFATLFLAEVYGMSPREEVEVALRNAVTLIINSQSKDGGWRYLPDGRDADISVTVCQIMALRAARNAGMTVPRQVVDLCTEYVRKCQNTDGGFRYRLEPRPVSIFPRSAAGVVALYSAGIYEGAEIEQGLEYLLRFEPGGPAFRSETHYYYGHYYAAQAMWQAGDTYWGRWYPAIRQELIARQNIDGSWTDRMICDEYGTAMALIVLQMPNNLLPIFQR